MKTAELDSKTLFGFWVYLMTDCMLFGTLFAMYVVLEKSANGLFSMPFALAETLVLLLSSFLCGMTVLAARQEKKVLALVLWGATFLLGVAFLAMELHEFADFVREGNSWQKNGFLSGFFTLVGTHGTHISLGLIWMGVMMVQLAKRGFVPTVMRRLACLRLFWHFLDLVWIFIFTFVYLAGGS
jgi:cytochrome o ubiquinol oxidase subunit III